MKIVICGSVKNSIDEINIAAAYFERLFKNVENLLEIVTPEIKIESIYKAQLIYVREIKSADLVVIVPKFINYENTFHIYDIGESTSYEMAIAKSCNIPVIIWKGNN